MMNLPIEVGDIILTGKFRNKPIEVAGFGKDDNNQPVVLTKNGKKIKILCIRIKKLMKEDASLKLTSIYEGLIKKNVYTLTKAVNPQVKIIIHVEDNKITKIDNKYKAPISLHVGDTTTKFQIQSFADVNGYHIGN